MKKILVLILALALSIGTASFAFADDTTTQSPKTRIERPQLQMNDEQKAKMLSLQTQMLELRKEILQQNVTSGVITEEQAQKMEERINERFEALKSGELSPNNGFGFRGRHGFRGKQQNVQAQ